MQQNPHLLQRESELTIAGTRQILLENQINLQNSSLSFKHDAFSQQLQELACFQSPSGYIQPFSSNLAIQQDPILPQSHLDQFEQRNQFLNPLFFQLPQINAQKQLAQIQLEQQIQLHKTQMLQRQQLLQQQQQQQSLFLSQQFIQNHDLQPQAQSSNPSEYFNFFPMTSSFPQQAIKQQFNYTQFPQSLQSQQSQFYPQKRMLFPQLHSNCAKKDTTTKMEDHYECLAFPMISAPGSVCDMELRRSDIETCLDFGKSYDQRQQQYKSIFNSDSFLKLSEIVTTNYPQIKQEILIEKHEKQNESSLFEQSMKDLLNLKQKPQLDEQLLSQQQPPEQQEGLQEEQLEIKTDGKVDKDLQESNKKLDIINKQLTFFSRQRKEIKPYKIVKLKTLPKEDQLRNYILAQETKNVSKNICLRLSKFATAEKAKFSSISKLREYLIKNKDKNDVYKMIEYLKYEFLIDIAHQTRNKTKIIYAKYRLKFINGLKDLENFKQLKF